MPRSDWRNNKAMKRRILSIILAVALMAALVVPASAAQSISAFTDITDAETAESVEVLRLLGVINGKSATKFDPYAKLTRAEFCKMAIIMLGREEAEPSYRTRTIFSDVTATHWARGYINLAASGEKAIISGKGNGKFDPNSNITWAEALTILRTGRGNCYCYAGIFCLLARQLGYDAKAIAGSTNWDPRPHAWVEIEFDGVPYIFDTEMEMASKGKYGKDHFYMLSYDIEATLWPYTK